MTAAITPAERLARNRRAQQLARHEVRIDPACPHCLSTRIGTRDGEVRCEACGRPTTEKLVRQIRRQRLSRFIRTGDR